jgi:hypothetical protein
LHDDSLKSKAVRIAPSVAILTASMSKLGDAVVAKALHESTVTKIATFRQKARLTTR